MMKSTFKKFISSDDGAVTVDWVVLTAAICALAVAAIVSIEGATGSAGSVVGDYLSEREVGGG